MNENFSRKKFQRKTFGGKILDKLKVWRKTFCKMVDQIFDVETSRNIYLLLSIGFQMHLNKLKKVLPNISARSSKIYNL